MKQTRKSFNRKMLGCIPMLVLCASSLSAQTADTASRAQGIARDEQAKAAQLQPQVPSRAEADVEKVETVVVDPLTNPNGFSLKLGGLPTGGGFSLGPRYTRQDLFDDHLISDTSVVGSTKEWWRGESSLTLPDLFRGHIIVKADAAYEDAASMPFFGEGPNSLKDNQTNFRREFTSTHLSAVTSLFQHRLTAGYAAGGLLVNVGPGNSNDYPSTDQLFSGSAVPGLTRQSNFYTGTILTQLDLTRPGFSNASGLLLEADDTQFRDQSGHQLSFHLLQTQATYSIPFFNGMRTFTLRARNETTFRADNQQIPFYLQPTLGGPNDLRGYERYRFYGNGASTLSGEYRWSITPAIEMAVFGDGGNVYQRAGLIGVRDLRGDGGIGVRFKNKTSTVMRLDLGVSPEGVKVWFVFNDAFGKLFRSF